MFTAEAESMSVTLEKCVCLLGFDGGHKRLLKSIKCPAYGSSYIGNTMAKKVMEAITDAKRVAAEAQIRTEQTVVDYETKEYIVELLVSKFITGLEVDDNELFVPDYQRDFVWDKKRQSKFIESVMLGLPIPYIFTAVTPVEDEDDEGRVEIVDGSQRIRTLAGFLQDELRLEGLEKLNLLNGFVFSDLEMSRRRKFNRRPIRIIELSEKADAAVRRDIFERINTGSDELKDMEKRKGIFVGAFYDFIRECAYDEKFVHLCPVSEKKAVREEREEMILRYFAYADGYETFKHGVAEFLNIYIRKHRAEFDEQRMRREFNNMLAFVDKNFPLGFKKSENNSSVPRVRFEAISVGVTLALRSKPRLKVPDRVIEQMLGSKKFYDYTSSDGSNSRPKVVSRIEYVRDTLLEGV
jgi:hypothetical protein